MAPEAEAEDPELHERILAQYLAVLRGAGQRRYDLDEGECLVIKGARDSGATWKQVADALGLDSPQGAQQRYETLGKRIAEAHSTGKRCTIIRELAAAQRESAVRLRDAIGDAIDDGVPWRAIGDALGMVHETAFRQFRAGSPIVVVKAYQSKGAADGAHPA